MICRRPLVSSRRQLLQRCSTGFGAVALSSLLNDTSSAAAIEDASRGQGKARDFFVHVWWGFARRFVRPEAKTEGPARQIHAGQS